MDATHEHLGDAENNDDGARDLGFEPLRSRDLGFEEPLAAA
jgi:hypothetical protein